MERPGQYVPLSIRFATGNTGSRIQERFGLEGLGLWAAYLVACRTHRPAGQISYASDVEALAILGVVQPRHFTLEEFWALTGQLKKTRRTRRGRVLDVKNTSWERWNQAMRREQERVRKARNRAQFKRDKTGTLPGHTGGQERDLEVEVETEKNPTEQNRSTTTQPPGLPDQESLEDLATRLATQTSRQTTLERALAICDQLDQNTPQVVGDLVALLPTQQVQDAIDETLHANGVRSRTRYLVRTLQRKAKEQATR